MAVAHVPKPYRTKLGASALWCVHLGLAAESKRMATRKLLSSTSGGATTEQQEQAQGEDAVLFLGDDQDLEKERCSFPVLLMPRGLLSMRIHHQLVDTSAWWEVGL
ncbi:hypothetical protein CLOP_g14983 [Closterium sp. NIES-67]|nr:hypothetical protein CLOP_g14983 [Closterium sp. NIES-67]